MRRGKVVGLGRVREGKDLGVTVAGPGKNPGGQRRRRESRGNSGDGKAADSDLNSRGGEDFNMGKDKIRV